MIPGRRARATGEGQPRATLWRGLRGRGLPLKPGIGALAALREAVGFVPGRGPGLRVED